MIPTQISTDDARLSTKGMGRFIRKTEDMNKFNIVVLIEAERIGVVFTDLTLYFRQILPKLKSESVCIN